MAVQPVETVIVNGEEVKVSTSDRWNLPTHVYTDPNGDKWAMPDPSYF